MGTENTLFSHKPGWRTNSETGAFLVVSAAQSQFTLKKPLVRLGLAGIAIWAAVRDRFDDLKPPKSGTYGSRVALPPTLN
jgi:hypothetical protein